MVAIIVSSAALVLWLGALAWFGFWLADGEDF